jgi:hypothetical protein
LLKEREIMSEFRIRDSTQTDLKREFERRMHTDWQRMIAALFAFAILDYLNMGLKVLKWNGDDGSTKLAIGRLQSRRSDPFPLGIARYQSQAN